MNRDDISSICSTMTDRSVSCFGEEMLLEDAIDHIFKEIQDHINQIHCELRNLCQSEERADTYSEAKEYLDDITLHIKEGTKVMKELIPVCKQLLPPKPKGWVDPKKLGALVEEPPK